SYQNPGNLYSGSVGPLVVFPTRFTVAQRVGGRAGTAVPQGAVCELPNPLSFLSADGPANRPYYPSASSLHPSFSGPLNYVSSEGLTGFQTASEVAFRRVWPTIAAPLPFSSCFGARCPSVCSPATDFRSSRCAPRFPRLRQPSPFLQAQDHGSVLLLRPRHRCSQRCRVADRQGFPLDRRASRSRSEPRLQIARRGRIANRTTQHPRRRPHH